jgi:hypothetical protein
MPTLRLDHFTVFPGTFLLGLGRIWKTVMEQRPPNTGAAGMGEGGFPPSYSNLEKAERLGRKFTQNQRSSSPRFALADLLEAKEKSDA